MSTEQSNAEFEKWWHAPEQHELRTSCAKGWGFRIWQASHQCAQDQYALEIDCLYDQIKWLANAWKVGSAKKWPIIWPTTAIISIKAYKRVNGKENGSQFD